MKQIMELPRQWQKITEEAKIFYLIKEKLKGKKLYLKGSYPPEEFTAGEPHPEHLEFYFSSTLTLDSIITLYITLNRQLEIDFQVLSRNENGRVLLHPIEGRISAATRAHTRQLVGGDMYATNFKIQKASLFVDTSKPQIKNRVIFNEFEQTLSKDYPGIKVFDYADKERPQETRLLDKTTGLIFVEDLSSLLKDTENHSESDPSATEPTDFILLLKKRNLLTRYIETHHEEQSCSLIVVPVTLEGYSEHPVTIGYIYYKTRQPDVVSVLQMESFKKIALAIAERVVDAATITVKDKQKIFDISERGIAFELTNPELMRMVPERSHFTFDLVFRKAAPIRFQARVCHIEKEDDTLIVGVDLAGMGHTSFKKNSLETLKGMLHAASLTGGGRV